MNEKLNIDNGAVLTEKERRKMRRNALIKMGAMGLFILIVLIFSSIAWFTMNREVEGTGAQMRSTDTPFEVAVVAPYTNTPDYSALLQSQFSFDTTKHETGSGTSEIKCLMTDATADANNPMRGMQPGSYGTITFQIKPKSAGTYTLHFDIATAGYHAEFATNAEGAILPNQLKTKTVEGKQVPIFYSLADYTEMQAEVISDSNAEQQQIADAREDVVNCPKAARFLQGHILFFENWDSSTKYYSKFINPSAGFNRSYTFTADDVAGNITSDRQEELTVTLYWIWPNTFGQMVLDNGNINLSERDAAMFSSSQTAVNGQSPREELTTYITAHGDQFFESTNAMFSDTVVNEVVTETEAAKIAASIAGLSTNPDNIIPLSNGYNNADQIIGENVQILFAEITASMPS